MNARRTEKYLELFLFCGLLLVFLSIWKGDGGYLDLRQYLDNAENLWLKGQLALPGYPGEPAHYHIHPLGTAVLAGPFVLLGAFADWLTGGALGARNIAVLCIPVYAAFACLLVYRIGRQLRLSALVSLWGAVILGVGSPMLSYTRMFFAEIGIILGICVAIHAFLKVRQSSDSKALAWALLSGTGLASVAACHFNSIFISAGLWVGMVSAFCWEARGGRRTRFERIAALSTIPVLAGIGLLCMNKLRFGSPLSTGYEGPLAMVKHPFSVLNVPINLYYMGFWVLHVPWVMWAAFSLRRLWCAERGLTLGICIATLAHLSFMLIYISLATFPIRHPLPVVAVLAPGLLLGGQVLWIRWQQRGLFYTATACIVWNAALFIRADDGTQTFCFGPTGGPLNCFAWYMTPAGLDTFGTPMGFLQYCAFTALVLVGVIFIYGSVRQAVWLDSPQCLPPGENSLVKVQD